MDHETRRQFLNYDEAVKSDLNIETINNLRTLTSNVFSKRLF